MTVPDPIHPEQPGREFKNYSEKFLNIRLTPNLAPSDIHLLDPLKTTSVINVSLMKRLKRWC
jgi:hypothetical protein